MRDVYVQLFISVQNDGSWHLHIHLILLMKVFGRVQVLPML